MSIKLLLLVLDALTLCAAIALLFQALKAHRSIRSTTTFTFTACFSFIALALLLRVATAGFINDAAPLIPFFSDLLEVGIGEQLGLLISVFFLLAGYTTLLLVIERISNQSIWILTFLMLLITVFLARNLFFITHVLAIIILVLLFGNFKKNYVQKRSANSLLVWLGFSSLLVGHAFAFFTPFSQYFQVFSLVFQLTGFFLLFAMAWRVART